MIIKKCLNETKIKLCWSVNETTVKCVVYLYFRT